MCCVSPYLPGPPSVLPAPLLPRGSFSKDETLSQSEPAEYALKPIFGEGVLWATSATRRTQQFRQFAYGLRTARLKSYVPMIEKETRDFLKTWGDTVRKDENRRRSLDDSLFLLPLPPDLSALLLGGPLLDPVGAM